jgi:hypothetical protein
MANAVMLTQEFAINNMFLPGQIENWVVVLDAAKTSLGSIPKDELKGMAQILGANYRSRMGRTWVLNTTMGVSILWKVISLFIDKETA